MKRIILDCDNTLGLPFKEIDDGLTLLYLLGRPDIHLLGVTTTFGNGTTDQAYTQTKELLRRANRAAIPVWKGQAQPGDEANPAAGFLAENAASYPGEVSVLATGPLTNLRAAARVDGRFFENLAQVTCMGGYLGPLRIGWRDVAELNLAADPQAAHAVLNAPCPVALMSAQLCLQAWFGWADLRKIRHLDPWIRKTVRSWLLAFGMYCGVSRFFLWDLAPAVYLTYPGFFPAKKSSWFQRPRTWPPGSSSSETKPAPAAGFPCLKKSWIRLGLRILSLLPGAPGINWQVNRWFYRHPFSQDEMTMANQFLKE